ncbi:DUF2188 domain-containing protein [Cupriavidus sp. AU9028]|uniref:DUF2188 domain-containing protein n=1 Tax=Cupriavidus sp. AU9028 TaxID=2871157 RepID=UPI001C97A472|nr:DUF2188 domain-containing protein [Cupriavidus sp. AU9028]MBY4898858.1 DUF2188 domain-containing protein [Cupriavidus sp. AU9028]
MNRNVHVIPTTRNGWAVEVEGTDGATSHYPSREEAVAAGGEKARLDKVDLIVHGDDGRIESRRHFGGTP